MILIEMSIVQFNVLLRLGGHLHKTLVIRRRVGPLPYHVTLPSDCKKIRPNALAPLWPWLPFGALSLYQKTPKETKRDQKKCGTIFLPQRAKPQQSKGPKIVRRGKKCFFTSLSFPPPLSPKSYRQLDIPSFFLPTSTTPRHSEDADSFLQDSQAPRPRQRR